MISISKSLTAFAEKYDYVICEGKAYDKLCKYRGQFFLNLCPCQVVTDDNWREAKLCPCDNVHEVIKRAGQCDCGVFAER